jgi:hypothetical protein
LSHVNKFVYICTMNIYLEKYKGIHPGIILERELKKRALQQRPFALSIGEHPQTLNAITKGKRKLNILQTYFDINEEKHKREGSTPNLSLIRKSLFWDTDITMIDWDKHYKAVVRRIFERGNETEKQELIHFYGADKINIALYTSTGKLYTIYKNK